MSDRTVHAPDGREGGSAGGGDFTDLVDLADERLGAAVVALTDEYFAPADALLRNAPPEYRPQEYTERGKWMDGWETRRRRDAPAEAPAGPVGDWCVVRLGVPGVVRGVVVDTAFFTGNFPESCWVEGCAVDGYPSPDELAAPEVEWTTIVRRVVLKGDTEHRFVSASDRRFTHVRLWIAPDGGVARFRVHGEVVPDPRVFAGMPLDLAAVENGGVVESCSDMYFSSRHNLAMPGPPRSMAEGWETRRLRGDGHDWAVVRLAAEGVVRVAEVDTRFFKGNAPSAFSMDYEAAGDSGWQPLIGRTRLQPNTRHRFFVPAHEPVVRVRLNVYPDGGLARLRLYGTLSDRGREEMALRRVNALPDAKAERELLAVCGSQRWAAEMTARRPFRSLDEASGAAREIWDGLTRDDWLEAFRAHPRIGERTGSAWSRQEQAGVIGADQGVLDILAKANRVYETRFGYVFLISAAGKSAQEMLDALRRRLGNDPENELRTAADEQVKIMAARLTKLFRPA